MSLPTDVEQIAVDAIDYDHLVTENVRRTPIDNIWPFTQPLIVRKKKGRYWLVSGVRRLLGAIEHKAATVPCTVWSEE